MIRNWAFVLAAGIAAGALAAEPPSDQRLMERAPGQRATTPVSTPDTGQSAQPAPAADELSQAERVARAEANVALAKLELVLARKALRDKEFKEAAQKAQRTLVLLRQVPPEVDVSELELQVEGILSRAAQAGVKVEGLARDAAADARLPEGDAELDRRVQAAGKIARQYSGSERPDIDTSGDARVLRERTLRRQVPDRYGYKPGREIIDVDLILARDQERFAYQDALRKAYKSDEVRMLIEADEARVVPDDVVTYPNDWPQRVARRKKWADGVVARSPSWYDKDGREWYVAIYDIHDLIYVPPDFAMYSNFGDPREQLQSALDRQALRDNSLIFRGSAADLEAGIPLLRYFGGFDPWVNRGPKYSAEKQAEVVNMIRAFTGARVEDAGAPPPNPR